MEKTRFAFFSALFSSKNMRGRFFLHPRFSLSLSLCFLLSSKRIRSTPSFDPPQFHLYPQMSGKREESKKTMAKTHLPPSHNEFVGCHSTSQYSVNPISSAAHLSLCSWLVWTKLDRYTVSQQRWPSSLPPIFRGERREKRKENNNNKSLQQRSKPIGWTRKLALDTATILQRFAW